MAFDAFIRGAQGVIFWGQEFVNASHVSWRRLQDVVLELSRLRFALQGEILYRHTGSGFSEWWVRTSEAVFAFAAHETRTNGGIFLSTYDPGEAPDAPVMRWNGETFIPDAALSPALPFSDPEPFGAYEIRVYRFSNF